MVAQQRGSARANALKDDLRVRLEETSAAPADKVYGHLADVRSHLAWGGTMQPKKSYRLLTIEAPDGPASVGTEFSSTGADAMGRFADSSVVTEASRPRLFEFVTEARLATKKGKVVDWTTVHRYELEPSGQGCRIAYTLRTVRISELPGPLAMFKVPGLRSLLLRIGGSNARRGLRNLARLAEDRAGSDRGRKEEAMAKASKSSAADHVELEGFEGHYAELGGTTVGWETYTTDADMTPMFVGLPDDRCQCEHWGYVFEGKVVFHTADGDEEFVGGDAYFVGIGHIPSIFAGTSLVEFSPTDRLQQTMEVVTRNMEAAGS